MTKNDFVYSRIGMALISAQRVEFVTSKLLENLVEFSDAYSMLTTVEFLEKTANSKNGKRTLGSIFTLLKLNPKLVIEEELDDYLKKRNLLVHNFWNNILNSKSDEKKAVKFCYDFGKHSERIERFFKGFVYLLSLRHVKLVENLTPEIRKWDSDFEYFMSSLKNKNLD